MKRVFTTIILISMMFIASITWSEIVYVNGTTGNDATGERGNPDKPFKTIFKGLDVAQHGDTVLVAKGIYKEQGLTFRSKIIEVRSEDGPESTIIDGENKAAPVFSFGEGEGRLSVVDGFTITGSNIGFDDGAIRCRNSSPTITNNIIIGNSSIGIYCDMSSPLIKKNIITQNNGSGIKCREGAPEIDSNLIMNNTATEFGGGIDCFSSAIIINNIIIRNSVTMLGGGGISCTGVSPQIINNTICFNTTNTTGSGGGIYSRYFAAPTVLNTILWGNTSPEIELWSATIYVTYSDIQGGWPGEGNIDADPMFVSATDYHLRAGSPCIDAGDPNSPKDPDGTRADMGAFYYSPSGDKVKKPPITTDFSDAIPSRSMLLPNYPNPFKLNPFNPTPWIPYHPKTWIPYLLATDASVIIRIYNTKGQLIHTIALGNKKAGTYMLKDQAAIWDGRNDTGARVGSGIYFYTLQAGDFIDTRRMVIY